MALTATINKISFNVGDTISVQYKIIEKEVVSGKTKKEKHEEKKERFQAFEGIVLAIRGTGVSKNFIVRIIGVANVGIERIFPVVSPWIKKITVKKKGHVRRAKLYYLRNKTNKEITRMGQRVEEIKTPEMKKVETSVAQVAIEPADNANPQTA